MQSIEANGAKIPALGFGTLELAGPKALEAVSTALAVGYRHIDTAQRYGNEQAVGRAIEESGIPREEIFLTTKVSPENFGAADLVPSVLRSLERLRTDYVDLLLLHWPDERRGLSGVMEGLGEVQVSGLADHLGLSNFTTLLVDEAWRYAPPLLVTNQVEYHPYLDQLPVLESARRRGMALTAYSPLARGRVYGDQRLVRIGRRHGKTAGQVALRWLLQQPGVVAIPRSGNPLHIAENFDVFDFVLSADEMTSIETLTGLAWRFTSPAGLAPAWD